MIVPPLAARWKLLLVLMLWCSPGGIAQTNLPLHGNWWYSHLVDDLVPFWTTPGAVGSPVGAFPSTRCNDGSAINFARPCPEVGGNAWLMQQQRFLVALSRQIYGYGVMFHMTGDMQYLEKMKAGVDWLRTNMIERNAEGQAVAMFTEQDLRTGVFGPRRQWRDPQHLSYGLLGLSFYYYLTRDRAVLEDIYNIKQAIFANYWNGPLGALQWLQENQGTTLATEKRLTAQLDQMNAYMILLVPGLDPAGQEEFKRDLRVLTNVLIEQFYSAEDNLFFLTANRPSEVSSKTAETDFGHTIKSFWMIRMVGQLTNDPELSAWAETNGKRVLARAYQTACGCWASGVRAGGQLNLDKSWWIYMELDQFAASLAMTDPTTIPYLQTSYPYFLQYFVDRTGGGEVHTELDGRTNLPKRDWPKAWPWKNAFHSTEHALVGYLTGRQLHGEETTLYFAFPQLPAKETIRLYYYRGEISAVEEWEDFRGLPGLTKIQAVTFRALQ